MYASTASTASIDPRGAVATTPAKLLSAVHRLRQERPTSRSVSGNRQGYYVPGHPCHHQCLATGEPSAPKPVHSAPVLYKPPVLCAHTRGNTISASPRRSPRGQPPGICGERPPQTAGPTNCYTDASASAARCPAPERSEIGSVHASPCGIQRIRVDPGPKAAQCQPLRLAHHSS